MNDAATESLDAPERPGDFALERFLPYRLSLLSNTVSEGIASAYRDVHGLSVNEWRVLAILGRFSGITASDIIARGAMDKVTVSRAVARLDDRGFVQRAADADDRRRVTLKLTRAGVRLFNEVVPEALAYERKLLESLAPEDRERLNGLLQRLQDAAEALNARR